MEKNRWNFLKKYTGWGVTIVVVSALVLTLFFCFYKFSALKAAIGSVISILMPVIYGLIIAYLISPIYEWLRKKLRLLFQKRLKWSGRRMEVTSLALALFLAFAIVIIIVVGLLSLVIPRLIESVTTIVAGFPSTVNTISQNMQSLFAGLFSGNSELEQSAMSLYVKAVTYVEDWVQNYLVPQVQQMFSYATDMLLHALTIFKNLLIGMIVSVYILINKKKFSRQAKKLLYAIFDIRMGNLILENLRFADSAFGGFLYGKIVDSAIIGLISGLILPLMNMPYSVILALVIGVTNIIPFFGPFIGAVPCTLVILMVSPAKALYFLIFIIILQQFDGNILGPKILGKTVGISSFWVLFSIILFGGLFGFVGMIIGVPLFAVISHLLSDLVSASLRQKKLPLPAAEYVELDHIDEETREMVCLRKEAEEPSVVMNDKRGAPPDETGTE